jgi:CRISPR/Cas system CSM-associated protein Csm3 (group 7 of RAMP superfamily)
LNLHGQLTDRALLQLYLKPVSPLHIGTGEEFLKGVVQFTVNGRRIPIIPAESIKGVLRADAGRLAPSLRFREPTAADVVRSHRKDKHELSDRSDRYLPEAAALIARLFPHHAQQRELQESREAILEVYASSHCPICKLFGSRYLAGKVLITDGIPVGEVGLEVYTSTAINRETRTVAENRLFKLQYVQPNEDLRFIVQVIADNLLDSDEGLLLGALLDFMLEGGLRLGGAKSRGYGLTQIDEQRSRVSLAIFNTNPASEEQKIENVKKLLFLKGSYEELSLREFVKKLRAHA